jgi:hypothetical protein
MRVKIVAFYEDHWMPPGTDRAQWDHLCRAYNADLQMVRSWDEVDIEEGCRVYILDEHGDFDLNEPSDIAEAMITALGDLPEKIVLVFGRTAMDLPTFLPEGSWHASYRITTPTPVPMFGVNAGAIALFSLYLLIKSYGGNEE